MGPYAYAIKISKNHKTITYNESVEIDSNSLTLQDLAFVGDDPFSICEQEYDGYEILVTRQRKETDEERDKRVAKEEAYMKEYNRRKQLRNQE